MKIFLRSALILCVSVGTASAALAQQVSLTMNNGRVTLKTQNATVRQILDEWARVGGTTVVNAEKITGQPVTLSLVDVPEGQALETVLRSAAGYMVSERQTPAAAGSRFERITVMARSTPVNSSSGSAAGNNANAYTPGPMPPGGGIEAPVNVVEDDGDPPAPMAPVVNPYAQGVNAAGANNNGVPGMGTGLGQQQAGQAGAVNPNATPAQQQNGLGVNPVTPGYSNVYGQSGATGAAAATTAGSGAGDTVTVNPPETKFDYANPQKYFQQRGQTSGTQAMQPYPGVPLSPTGAGTGTTPASTSTPANPGTGTAGTVTPTVPTNTPSNQNPYSPNFNPYNLPAGAGVPGSTSATPQQSVEPDRAKYANPYVQPTNPPE